MRSSEEETSDAKSTDKPDGGILDGKSERDYNMNEKRTTKGGFLMFLLKLPFRAAALPLLAALIIIRLAAALITGLSSIVTNILGTVALAAAAGIWMFNLGTSQDAYKMIGFALLLFFVPHLADWLVEKVTDFCATLLAYIVP